jgi:hypothetical protein
MRSSAVATDSDGVIVSTFVFMISRSLMGRTSEQSVACRGPPVMILTYQS